MDFDTGPEVDKGTIGFTGNGWGKPINAGPNDKVHWWNSDCRKACADDTSFDGYAGKRLLSSAINVSEICQDCLNLVTTVLGNNFLSKD
jgi:hypothetical protein